MTDRLSIYDMDKTITRRASWMAWLFHFARTEAPARLFMAPLMLLPALAYAVGALDRGGLKQATHRLMMGRRVHRSRVERAAQRFAERFGAAQELPGALAAIAADRAAGCTLMLATASSHYYAEALARRWGFDRVIATRNHWEGDDLTPLIDGENCYDAAKLRMILADLPERPAHVAFASDHVSDLPALLWADQPLAANPSAALLGEAISRGWPVAFWAKAARPATPPAAADRATAPTETPSRAG